jgi:hypothetical protein
MEKFSLESFFSESLALSVSEKLPTMSRVATAVAKSGGQQIRLNLILDEK